MASFSRSALTRLVVGVFLCTIGGPLFLTVATAETTAESEDGFVCGVYVAPSTLPGTGLGMYAGSKGYKAGELISKTLGDHIISIPDQKETHSDTGLYDGSSEDMTKYFLWDQYTWNPTALGIGFGNIALRDAEIASPGFGAAANSFMDFVNVDEGGPDFGLLPPEKNDDYDDDYDYDDYNIHRSKDPGAGAFTQYHSRKAWAKHDIEPNSEFFVSYGDDWFLDRAWRLGVIPVQGDHQIVENLWKGFHQRFLKNENKETANEVFRSFWKEFLENGKDLWPESRIFAAMPSGEHAEDHYRNMVETKEEDGGYIVSKQSTMKRSQEWLEEHGICADSVRIGRSTLPNKQAGHGAFARTHFQPGEAIMSAPLIHIPDRAILNTFFQYDKRDERVKEIEREDEDGEDNEDEDFDDINNRILSKYQLPIGYGKTGEQLMLNYVFGHKDSTMALSPYGPGVQLINHNQTLVNAKLAWAQPHRSNHHPELLERSVEHIQKEFPMGSVLGMEVIATRAIKPGDEIFLDYGDDWEAAWQKHTKEWTPTPDADGYISAVDLNTRPEYTSRPLANSYPGQLFGFRNEDGIRQTSPFPKNVRLLMNAAWRNETHRELHGDDSITDLLMFDHYDYDPVAVLYKTGTLENPFKYEFEDREIFESYDLKEQELIQDNYNMYEDEIKKKKAEEENASAEEEKQLFVEDNTLYTVMIHKRIEYDEEEEEEAERLGKTLPTYEVITAEDVPRRGLKFEDLSYTHDQFLPNAFREYIRIPDEIFPEAWKNMKTQKQKKQHYWEYRNPFDADRKDILHNAFEEDFENDDGLFEEEANLDDVEFYFLEKYNQELKDEEADEADEEDPVTMFAEETEQQQVIETLEDDDEDLPAAY